MKDLEKLGRFTWASWRVKDPVWPFLYIELMIDGSQEVTFLYKLTPGIAHRSYGYVHTYILSHASLNVARLANLPNEVITIASEKSRTMEEETKQREAQRWFDNLQNIINS